MKSFVLAALLTATKAVIPSTPQFCQASGHDKICKDWRDKTFASCANTPTADLCLYCCMRVETVEWPKG